MKNNLGGDIDWVDRACDVLAVTAGLIGFFSIVVQCVVEGYHWLRHGISANYSLLHFLTEEQTYSILDTGFLGLNRIIFWTLNLWVSLLFLAAGLLLAWFFSMISRVRV